MGEPGGVLFEHADYSGAERIGQGGVGVVYRATRRSTGAPVAIKVLRDVTDDSVVWHRIRREMTALVALAGHPNVIQLVEQVELDHDGDRAPALVMEYAPGGSVAEFMTRRGDSLTIAEAVLVGEHTAAALVAAHEQGIVHRDVKPQNLLIDAGGQIKLCDFGIASLTRTEGFETRTSAWSMRYASPEDLDDEAEVGPPSDVYSLGATLLHLVHGGPPTLKQRLVEWVPPPAADRRTAILDSVLADCLHPNPERRPTAVDLHERLEQIGSRLDERRRALTVEPIAVPRFAHADEPAPLVGASPRSGVAVVLPVDHTSSVSSTDDTLTRSGRRPLRRPEVESAVRRRWPVVVTSAAVFALVCLGIVVMWPTGPPESVGSTSPPTSAQPTMAQPTSDGAASAVAPTGPGVSIEPAVETRSPSPVVAAQIAEAQVAAVESFDLASGLRVVERPVGLVDIDDDRIVWPFGEVGECLVQLDADTELRPVACDEPHDLQRVQVAELDPAAFSEHAGFDVVAVQTAVDLVCRRAAESFVGSRADADAFDLPVTRPSAATWNLGDRRFQCLLGVAEHRIVGDATLRVD